MDQNVTVSNGKLVIDLIALGDLIDEGDETAWGEIARAAAFSEPFVRRVVDHLVDGCTEDGDTLGPGTLERLRMALLPRVDEVVAELVADLARERDQAKENERRWRSACFTLEDEWDTMDRQRKGEVCAPPYDYKRAMTREQALAYVQRMTAEIEGVAQP